MNFTFDFFSGSADFSSDAHSMYDYTLNRLQDDILDVELNEQNSTDNYGTAALKYFNRAYEYFFQNHLLDLNIYGDNSVLSKMSPVIKNYQIIMGGMIGAGLNRKMTAFSASANKQDYYISSSLPSGTNVNNIEITEVFYTKPSRKMFLYPGASGISGMKKSLGILANTPMFMPNTKTMLIRPNSEMYRWRQSFHTFQNMIVSDYRYEVLDGNKKIRLIPAPSDNIKEVYFEYVDLSGSQVNRQYIKSPGFLPDMDISYDNLNLFAKSFIIELAYGYSLISIGDARSKYDSVPIPDANISMNGSELTSRGSDIIDSTFERLDEVLEKLEFSNLIEERKNMIDNASDMITDSFIIVG